LARYSPALAFAVPLAPAAFADKPGNRPPPDRGKKVPVCTLGVELGGDRICIIP
jgi:hypothetical protein